MKSNLTTMVVSLTVIACAMGAALGLVHDATAGPIADAKARQQTEALHAVLPADCQDAAIGQGEEVTVPGDQKPVMVYTASAPDGKPAGYAVETWTMDGFSGEITVMAGFAPDGALSGYQVLQSAETPGLGSKAEEWFRSTVAGRSIIGSTASLKVSKDGGEIDGITAATITSRAFLGAINRARAAFEIATTGSSETDANTSASTKEHKK